MKASSEILLNTRPLLLILFCMFIGTEVVSAKESNNPNEKIRINPEYKVSRISNGSVIVTSVQPGKKAVKHEFNDLYADILLAANRKMNLEAMSNLIQKKYYLSEDDCRREIKHAINVLSEWKIIIREESVALR